ncbi:MAG: hypothetical protein V2A76_12760 [Planctomycetota bacterium]
MLKLTTTLKTAMLLGALFLAPLAGAAEAGHDRDPRQGLRSFALKAGHEHEWVRSTKQVWVPPVYQNKRVGTDAKGKPIYEKVLVRKGVLQAGDRHEVREVRKDSINRHPDGRRSSREGRPRWIGGRPSLLPLSLAWMG